MGATMEVLYRQMVTDGALVPDPAQEAVLPEFERIRADLAKKKSMGLLSRFRRMPNEPCGLYIWGGVGRGKSMLMDLFFQSVDIAGKRRVHFHAFMQEVQAGLHEARKTDVDDAILPVAKAVTDRVRLLCLDEMQITDITDAMIVGRLFEQFFEAGMIIVTTSNRVPSDLYKDGLNRQLFEPFIALLEERMVVWELASPKDYRQNRLGEEQVYFHPANAEARATIETIWQDLSGGQGTPLRLAVKGRTFEIPQARNGVGRASFWDLCAKPLGPADYLALAEAIRVLILEDVPLLSSENYNEAKRFVTLIDALYEARTRAIISAADVPERLYIEGAGSFEFERTASRLKEMQSADWFEDRA